MTIPRKQITYTPIIIMMNDFISVYLPVFSIQFAQNIQESENERRITADIKVIMDISYINSSQASTCLAYTNL